MVISFLQKLLKDIPISKKLYFTIGIMVLLITIELCTLGFAIGTLSSVRSYVGGEGLFLSVLLILVITGVTAGILITVSVSRGIEKGLKEITRGSDLIKKGILSTRVKVYSRDEIGILATSFNQMTDTLENNMRERRDIEESLKIEKARAEASEKVEQLFLANMSHEIRTPMNAILGFARILEESHMDKEQLEYMHAIIKSGDDLLVILNDILALSKIEEGKMVFENTPFNIKDIIDSTALMSRSKSALKNINLNCYVDERIPEIICGDSVRLNQILMNLVSNAIKFTEKGEITIAVHCIEENDNNIVLEFSIKDTGIGIPIEKQNEIFEGFDQTPRKFGSTGLGLSIVKQLVERQNGKIFVNSKPGQGSDFHFILSFEKPTEMEHTVKVPKEVLPEFQTAGSGKREVSVLLVEDNLMNQILAIKVLQKYGFEADVAENGKVALDKHAKNKYDIILMDLQMPEMDGYETTRNIRLMENGKKDIPIIAMTAHTIKGEIERCIDVGMTDYLSKPFHADELYKKIRSLVNRVAL